MQKTCLWKPACSVVNSSAHFGVTLVFMIYNSYLGFSEGFRPPSFHESSTEE